MAERVVALDADLMWEPNGPKAVLLTSDGSLTLLALNARMDDPDQRCVVLVWSGCLAATMQPPNDEALSGHRLYDRGLSEVMWLGEVHDSQWIADIERRNRVHPYHDPSRYETLRHFVMPLKECTVEVVAENMPVVVREGRPNETAVAAALVFAGWGE